MKKKSLFLIGINILSLILFFIIIFQYSNNKLAIILSLSFLLISAFIATVSLIKNISGAEESRSKYRFLLFWFLFSVAILLGSIFIWNKSLFLLNFSIISLFGSTGATIGAYIRYKKLRNR